MNSIENKFYKLEFNLKGGTMSSIYSKKYNKEMQYQVMEKSWQSQDVVIFPVIGRLKDLNYTVDGKIYSLQSHGLCRYNNFKIIEQKENKVVLEFLSNEETLKSYPFDFAFYVSYELIENEIKIKYTIKNTGNKEMFFGVGGHPAIRINSVELENESDTSGNYLDFGKDIKTIRYVLGEDGFIFKEEDFVLPQKYEVTKSNIRENQTLMLDASDIHECIVRRKDGINVFVRFNTKYLAIWSHPQFGDYICVEPWESLPDLKDNPKELKDKKTINCLKPGNIFDFAYSICVE